MKKIYLFSFALLWRFNFLFAGGSCLIDSSNTSFLAPHPDSLACAERGLAYSQSIQFLIPDSIDLMDYGASSSFILYVDSVIFNGVDGLPTGISDNVNPSPGGFYPGTFVCLLMEGTTTDTSGRYSLSLNGNITAHGAPYPPIFDGDTTVDLVALQLMALGQLDIYLDVIERGAACRSLWPADVCIVDPFNTDFFSPSPDSIPCIERGVYFDQTIQIHVPSTFDIGPFAGLPPGLIILKVDSMEIDSLTGFPQGLSYELNPADGFFLGGDNGCSHVSGVTNAPNGNYPLNIYGYIAVSGIPQGFGFPPDTMFNLATAQSLSNMFNLSVDVVNQGDVCRPTSGVKDFISNLNSSLFVYPNPNHGTFELKLNSGRRVLGSIVVSDMLGRNVFSQAFDATGIYQTTISLNEQPNGIYFVSLKTSKGFATKRISIE